MIVDCFESICNNGAGSPSADSLTDARSLQLAITTTEIISARVITDSCLKYIQALTSSLQAEAEVKDIVTAVREIDTVTATVQDVRDNIEIHHFRWFLTVLRCFQIWVLSHVSHEDEVRKSTAAMCEPADTPNEYY